MILHLKVTFFFIQFNNMSVWYDNSFSCLEDESSEEDGLLMSVAQRVDSCTATVYPPLNPDHEKLSWPQRLLDQFKIQVKFSHDGVTLLGSESTNHYEQVKT